jgi:hypothetical protein
MLNAQCSMLNVWYREEIVRTKINDCFMKPLELYSFSIFGESVARLEAEDMLLCR